MPKQASITHYGAAASSYPISVIEDRDEDSDSIYSHTLREAVSKDMATASQTIMRMVISVGVLMGGVMLIPWPWVMVKA